MSFAQIQLISVILAEIIFIIVPFLAVFRREWRYSMSKTTGILMGYLFFVYVYMLQPFPVPALAGAGVVLHHHDHQHTCL